GRGKGEGGRGNHFAFRTRKLFHALIPHPPSLVPHPPMRYGYWLPVFGGWLRDVEDENMQASWQYVSRLARRSEEMGFDLTLIAELNLNDIKGVRAPSLDAWSTAAALAAV